MERAEKILVIDDHPIVLEGIVAWFELQGFRVVSAKNGRDGLERAGTDLPDLIICDYSMPDLDGLEVLEAIKRNPETAEVPFILYSGYLSRGVKEKCLQLRAYACLDKAERIEKLLETVRQVLDH